MELGTALVSGALGALLSQLLAIWNARKLEAQRNLLIQQLEHERRAFEISQAKLSVLRKFAGNRAAITNIPIDDQRSKFFESLNEIIVAFSDSGAVIKALNEFREAATHGSPARNDGLVTLFKTMCLDTGIDLSAFNDSLFLV